MDRKQETEMVQQICRGYQRWIEQWGEKWQETIREEGAIWPDYKTEIEIHVLFTLNLNAGWNGVFLSEIIEQKSRKSVCVVGMQVRLRRLVSPKLLPVQRLAHRIGNLSTGQDTIDQDPSLRTHTHSPDQYPFCECVWPRLIALLPVCANYSRTKALNCLVKRTQKHIS